jgi:hypothetical protein
VEGQAVRGHFGADEVLGEAPPQLLLIAQHFLLERLFWIHRISVLQYTVFQLLLILFLQLAPGGRPLLNNLHHLFIFRLFLELILLQLQVLFLHSPLVWVFAAPAEHEW